MQIKKEINSSSMLEYTDNRVTIASGRNSVSTTNDNGNFINGPLSISSNPLKIRIGGIYKFHPLTLTGIPSTSVTPIPTFLISSPIGGTTTSGNITSSLKALI